MKVRLHKTAWQVMGGICASFVLVVSFQNCGKAGFDAELGGIEDSGSSDASLSAKYGESTAQKVKSIPFAFDAGFDTISYNSCAETHLRNNSAFTSLKAGSYQTGGIALKNQFYSYVDQNFKPTYPETSITENQYKEYLADSPLNANAVVAAAIRPRSSLSDVYLVESNSGSPALNKDVVPMVGTLTDALVMDAFIPKGITAHYFPFSPEFKVMEAGFNFNSDETRADVVRDIFANSGILSVTYMMENEDINKVRSSSTSVPVKTAYGRGYSLAFSPYPAAGADAMNPNRVLASVTESDLTSPSVPTKQWSCGRVYSVLRTQDAVACPAHTYAEIKNNPTIRSELDIFRRQFRADQWDVNVTLRCAIPKGGVSCYKEENLAAKNFAEVEYDLTKTCFRPNASYGGTPPTSKCMHFLTVCTRD